MEKVRANWTFDAVAGVTLLILAIGLSGCGAVGSSPTPQTPATISIALTQAPPKTVVPSGTATISATVSNDSANGGVDWSCAPAGACGSFSPAHTASGATTTYTAPSAAGSVTITATSTTSHTTTAVATVTVTTASSGSVAISLTAAPPANIPPSGTATISATVTNDSANAGVDWTCTPKGTCGSFNPAHTASGANTTYTAPGTAGAVVITATATSSATTTAAANVTVGGTNNSATLTPGTYTFYAGGEDSKKNTYAVAGAFALVAGGTISGGELDYVSAGGATSPQPGGDKITGGTWTIGANGLGKLTLVTAGNTALGVAGTETFSIAEVNIKHAMIGEFDSGATSSGSMDLQTLASPKSLAELNGPFAFTVSGKIGTKAEAFGGTFTANAAGGLDVTELDANEGGTITRGGNNSTATYTAPDASGRGTFAFGGNHFVYYVVNAKVLRIVVTDGSEPDLGSAYAGVSGITNASVAKSYVFTDSSILSSGAFYAAAGKLTFDATGKVTSGFADVDENGTHTGAAVTGTYAVNANGYGTLTLTPGATQDISVLGLYLTDPTINPTDPNSPADAGLGGLLLDLDTKLTGCGQLIALPTAATTFTGNYALNTQASNATNEGDAVGVVAVSGTKITGAENLNDLFGTGQGTAVAISGTLTPDATNSGRFTIPVLVNLATNPPTLNYVLYQASSTQFIVLEDDNPQFALGTLEKQQ